MLLFFFSPVLSFDLVTTLSVLLSIRIPFNLFLSLPPITLFFSALYFSSFCLSVFFFLIPVLFSPWLFIHLILISFILFSNMLFLIFSFPIILFLLLLPFVLVLFIFYFYSFSVIHHFLCFLLIFFSFFCSCICTNEKNIFMNNSSSTSSWKLWRWVSHDLIFTMRDIH